MIVDVLHPNRANASKTEVAEKLAQMYNVEAQAVTTFGFRTAFGGGKSTGFALIYDSVDALKKFEPHYRQVRAGLATKVEKASRQQRKQRKNRNKKGMSIFAGERSVTLAGLIYLPRPQFADTTSSRNPEGKASEEEGVSRLVLPPVSIYFSGLAILCASWDANALLRTIVSLPLSRLHSSSIAICSIAPLKMNHCAPLPVELLYLPVELPSKNLMPYI